MALALLLLELVVLLLCKALTWAHSRLAMRCLPARCTHLLLLLQPPLLTFLQLLLFGAQMLLLLLLPLLLAGL
jgi:hypothetical protein